MWILAYLLSTAIVKSANTKSTDYPWRDEMQKKIKEQREEIKKMESERENRHSNADVDVNALLSDIAVYKKQTRRNMPTL